MPTEGLGPPGAGKSTVARAVSATFEPSVLVEGDAFFGFLDQGAIEPWLPESRALVSADVAAPHLLEGDSDDAANVVAEVRSLLHRGALIYERQRSGT